MSSGLRDVTWVEFRRLRQVHCRCCDWSTSEDFVAVAREATEVVDSSGFASVVPRVVSVSSCRSWVVFTEPWGVLVVLWRVFGVS